MTQPSTLQETVNIKDSYNLKEIADWQLNHESKIRLPYLQRGFVWKSIQIIELWDSILRGYPIGALMMSKNGYLYDGQQRSTAIAIGMYNPWGNKDEKHFFRLKDIPTLWIDLMPIDNSSFNFSLCTKSHPWGYNSKGDILSISKRKQALKLFENIEQNKGKRYIDFGSQYVIPFDLKCPVPIGLLLNEKDEEGIKTQIDNFYSSNEQLKLLINKKNDTQDLTKIENLDKEFIKKLSKAIKNIEELKVPIVQINTELLSEGISNKTDEEENPTLFVRINAGGTPLSGEELIYSVYKAKFPKVIDIVEQQSSDFKFIAPSRIISLATRIVHSNKHNEQYCPPLKGVEDFNVKLKDIEKELKSLIEDKSLDTLFKRVNKIFDNEEIKIPKVVIKQLLKDNTDLFYLLLFWLNKYPNENANLKGILGWFTAIAWFCDPKFKKKYVSEIWDATLNNKKFWKEIPISPYQESNNEDTEFMMCPLPSTEAFEKFFPYAILKFEWNDLYFTKTKANSAKDIKEYYNNFQIPLEDVWDMFINKLVSSRNKGMILFAQRNYINDYFQEFSQIDDLEDTNTPWDWDHIYPTSNVYRKKGVDSKLRFWNNSIGNLRALDLTNNRAEGDNFYPLGRLEDERIRLNSFISNNDWENWKEIDKKIDNEKLKFYLQAIGHRICNIYKEWYNTLDIKGINFVEK